MRPSAGLGMQERIGIWIEWWKRKKASLRNTYSTILKLQKALFYCSKRCAPKKNIAKDKIALHVQYEIPLWIDEWMDSHLFESKSG